MTETAATAPDGCPDLDQLEPGRPSAAVRAHVAGCEACRMVVELIDVRSEAAAARSHAGAAATPSAACARFELMLAAREDGDVLSADVSAALDDHLANCPDCRLVVSFSPESDRSCDHSDLPLVETTAYSLGAEVARGGMGRILAARDLRIGRPVAVKELLGRSPSLAARFEREARVTARLQHPGIVPIYEIGKWPDGTPFYSMRLVDGRTLREALAAGTTLAARLALLPAVIAAVEAIAFAHSKHVIHRDLTPSNIIVGAYGETVVIDWGLAKDRAEPDAPDAEASDAPAPASPPSSDLTAAGQVIGTATYMPPEQASGAAVDERADVYALGAILYHLLAGVAPYVGRREEVLAQVQDGPPRPIEVVAPGAPGDLISIVTKAMAHDRARRYATAHELSEELNRFQTGRLVEAHVYSRRELWRRWVRRNRAGVLAGGAALIGIAIAATISVGRVIAERDRAEAERAAAVAASARLLEEQGRQELLAGNPMRAAAWLGEAYAAGNEEPSLRLLLGLALLDVELLDRTVDCGGEVQSLEFDAAGGRLLAACEDVVKVWRIGDFTELASLSAPGAKLASARFSHDGALILTRGPDTVARLWDGATGALRHALSHPNYFAAFTPDDRTVITAGFDGAVRMWNIGDGREVRALQVGVGVRGQLAPDGVTLVTATAAGRGTAWNLTTGAQLGTIAHGAPIVGGNLSHDGTRASTCGADRTARVWNAQTGALVQTLAAHADVVLTCKFSPDGTRLLTTSQDGTAKVWDIASGRVVTSVSAGGVVGDGRFSPDGRAFTTARLDGWLRLWSTETGALIAAHDDPRGTLIHAFAADGSQLYAARRDGRIRIIDLRRTRLRHEFTPPPGEQIVGATADGSKLVTRRDRVVTAWDVATGAAVTTGELEPSGWGDAADEMAVVGLNRPVPSTTGPFVVGVDADAVARVWDASQRELAAFPIARLAPTLTQEKYETATGTARFAPDGHLVIVSTGIAVWDLPSERRTPAEVTAIVRDRLAWQIRDGKLAERTSELRVVVTGRAHAQRGVVVQAVRVPDTVEGTVVGSTSDPPVVAVRSGDGSHRLALAVGRYDVEIVEVGRPTITRRVALGPEGATIEVVIQP